MADIIKFNHWIKTKFTIQLGNVRKQIVLCVIENKSYYRFVFSSKTKTLILISNWSPQINTITCVLSLQLMTLVYITGHYSSTIITID